MEDRNKDLEGKVAIVTGSGVADGIGFTIATTLARGGAKVVLTDRKDDELADLAATLRNECLDATYTGFDLSNEASIEGLIKKAVADFGKIDILVNNAAFTGPPGDSDVVNMDAQLWDDLFAINARGVMLTCKHAIPEMLKAGGGSIVNITSGASLAGGDSFTGYACSKSVVITLTKYIAAQYGTRGVRCNTLALGVIPSEHTLRVVPPPILKILQDGSAVGHLGKAEDVAEFIRFLASDYAAYVTGQVIPLDGGYTAIQHGIAQIRELMAQMQPPGA